MRPRTCRPRLEPLDDRCLPSLTLSGTYSLNYIPIDPGLGLHRPMAVGDFDGDGNADLAVASSEALDAWPAYYVYTVIEVLPGRGDGSFDPARAAYVSDQHVIWGIAAGDVNGDGRSDLAVNGSEFSLLGNADGSFSGPDQSAFIPPPAPPDMNGDGYSDGVWIGYPPPLILHWAGRVQVSLHWPDGTYSPILEFEAGGPTEAAVGDFNEDGRPDVAAANRWGGVTVLLNDGDWPSPVGPSVRVSDATVTEGHEGTRDINFTVSLSAAHSQPVTVTYQTADATAAAGSDYTAASDTLTFAPGETEKTITVLVNGDRLGEPSEYFYVNLSVAPTTPVLDSQGMGTILDDEPSVSITDVARKEGQSGTTLFVFIVTLSAASDVPVTINYGTLDGTARAGEDYTAATFQTLTFAPGQTTTNIIVAVMGDRQAEADEYFNVNLSSPNAHVADSRGIGTILDDEPRISITDVARKEGRSGTTRFVFTVTLSAAYDVPVTVNYATADGTAKAGEDYVAKSGTLTFAPGQTTKRIAVRVKGEWKNEADETFFVNLSGATNAMLVDPTGLGTILNDD
jgi:Calx-beta domain/FG-GAP-like repeat